ncbi:MAG: hypothetical protein CMJ74_12400 [Planctomycetaceae bacterium]|nr:hypothetical protein [Planctomycetaceae bacterium]
MPVQIHFSRIPFGDSGFFFARARKIRYHGHLDFGSLKNAREIEFRLYNDGKPRSLPANSPVPNNQYHNILEL